MLSSVVAGSLIAATAPAPPEATWLAYEAPSSCPTQGALEQAAAARLGRAPQRSEITASTVIRDRGPQGLHLTLETTRDGLSDSHSMVAHDCRALIDAAGLLIALTVDPIAVAGLVGQEAAEPDTDLAPLVPPSESRTDPPAETPFAADPPTEPSAPRRPVPRAPAAVMLAVAGQAELGALPNVSGGPKVHLAFGIGRARLELGGWYAAPRTSTGTPAVRAQMGAASLLGCGRFLSERIEVPLCAGVEVGGIRGEGIRAPQPQTSSSLWVAPMLSTGVHVRLLPRLSLASRVDLAVPARRTTFEVLATDPSVDSADEVFTTGPLSARVWFGIEGKLWERRDGSGASRRRSR